MNDAVKRHMLVEQVVMGDLMSSTGRFFNGHATGMNVIRTDSSVNWAPLSAIQAQLFGMSPTFSMANNPIVDEFWNALD